MRLFFISLFTFMAISLSPVAAYNASVDDDAKQIRTVIENQMAAFQRDDADAAFSFAAPEIQAKFRTAERFMKMVKHGYQAVYRPQHVEFFSLAQGGDGTYHQHVIVQAQDGTLMMAVYPMTQDAEGQWRIAGVYLAPMQSRKAT